MYVSTIYIFPVETEWLAAAVMVSMGDGRYCGFPFACAAAGEAQQQGGFYMTIFTSFSGPVP